MQVPALRNWLCITHQNDQIDIGKCLLFVAMRVNHTELGHAPICIKVQGISSS